MNSPLTLFPVPGLPRIGAGDDLGAVVARAIESAGAALRERDVIVVAQKIVSKAEARTVDLETVSPSQRARELACTTGKDPRLVEVILSQSRAVLRYRRDVLIVEHHLGFVMANAGIDRSNLDTREGGERVLLLPVDPDASARSLRRALEGRFGVSLGVIVSDSVGRPWRMGTTGMALGAAGVPALLDRRGQHDLYGRRLEVTEIAFADQIAAAAALVMGEGDEGLPVAIVRNLSWEPDDRGAAVAIRPREEDLFRT